eukprot:NODE_4913_length_1831_cov_9.984155.p1 GENE.NODE_4913_length_1831_cov_9.984155~~NODE_4913_length_1831_cov_9.984155.p1  ORF type:complete len:487 (-),score=129.05 NODE_4913_length_1831_cov_9.984155:324-1784(-)
MAKTCAECKKAIEDQSIAVGGEQFHPDCFICNTCKERIYGKFSKSPDGKRICPHCVPKHTCSACDKTITGQVAKVGEKFYHTDCFNCSKCANRLTAGYVIVDGQLQCEFCTKQDGVEVRDGGKISKCTKCKKTIEGEVIEGDRRDVFHEECFTCEGCKCKLVDFVVDPNRTHKYMAAQYYCVPCGEKAFSKAGSTSGPDKKCCMCGGMHTETDQLFTLLDGTALHWRCFTCHQCGTPENPTTDPAANTLLRARVTALREGRFLCATCITAGQDSLGDAPDLTVARVLTLGSYLGKSTTGDQEVKYAIKLMGGGACHVDNLTVMPGGSSTWHAEGSYKEQHGEDRQITSVQITVAKSGGDGPKAGEMIDAPVKKTSLHDLIVYGGVDCPLLAGVPDFEIRQMMLPPAVEEAAAAAPEKSAFVATTTSFTLAQLQDPNVYKASNVNPATRELYLADDVFVEVFGITKEAFSAQPKWKRDKLKKDNRLY